MQRFGLRVLLALVLAYSFCVEAHASAFSFLGNFTLDDNVRMFDFQLLHTTTVTIRTFGYAGGTNAAGMSIAAGGFDPALFVFDAVGGFELGANDDGGCPTVAADPATGACHDAFLVLPFLSPGRYVLALTESPNTALGPTVADGFALVGAGNFTCSMFLGSSGSFCDSTLSQRDAHFALDISGADSAQPARSNVPEPPAALLLLSSMIGVGFCTRLRTVLQEEFGGHVQTAKGQLH